MSQVKLSVKNDQKKIAVPNGLRTIIRKCCEQALKEEQFTEPAEVSVTFVDNEEIRQLNNEFRNKDSATDVLSFPLGENGEYDLSFTVCDCAIPALPFTGSRFNFTPFIPLMLCMGFFVAQNLKRRKQHEENP